MKVSVTLTLVAVSLVLSVLLLVLSVISRVDDKSPAFSFPPSEFMADGIWPRSNDTFRLVLASAAIVLTGATIGAAWLSGSPLNVAIAGLLHLAMAFSWMAMFVVDAARADALRGLQWLDQHRGVHGATCVLDVLAALCMGVTCYGLLTFTRNKSATPAPQKRKKIVLDEVLLTYPEGVCMYEILVDKTTDVRLEAQQVGDTVVPFAIGVFNPAANNRVGAPVTASSAPEKQQAVRCSARLQGSADPYIVCVSTTPEYASKLSFRLFASGNRPFTCVPLAGEDAPEAPKRVLPPTTARRPTAEEQNSARSRLATSTARLPVPTAQTGGPDKKVVVLHDYDQRQLREMPIVCGECGDVLVGSKFCPQCGSPVKSRDAAFWQADTIVSIAGIEIHDKEDEEFAVGQTAPGEEVDIVVLRRGKPLRRTLVMEANDAALGEVNLLRTAAGADWCTASDNRVRSTRERNVRRTLTQREGRAEESLLREESLEREHVEAREEAVARLDSLAPEVGVDFDDNDGERGLRVCRVTSGKAGYAAGLRQGDVITRLGEVDTNEPKDIECVLNHVMPGERLPVTVKRGDADILLWLTIGGRGASLDEIEEWRRSAGDWCHERDTFLRMEREREHARMMQEQRVMREQGSQMLLDAERQAAQIREAAERDASAVRGQAMSFSEQQRQERLREDETVRRRKWEEEEAVRRRQAEQEEADRREREHVEEQRRRARLALEEAEREAFELRRQAEEDRQRATEEAMREKQKMLAEAELEAARLRDEMERERRQLEEETRKRKADELSQRQQREDEERRARLEAERRKQEEDLARARAQAEADLTRQRREAEEELERQRREAGEELERERLKRESESELERKRKEREQAQAEAEAIRLKLEREAAELRAKMDADALAAAEMARLKAEQQRREHEEREREAVVKESRARLTTMGAILGAEMETMKALNEIGLLVRSVRSGKPADAAGLRVGDLLRRVDGKIVKDLDDLHLILRQAFPGKIDVFDIERGKRNKRMSLSVMYGGRGTSIEEMLDLRKAAGEAWCREKDEEFRNHEPDEYPINGTATPPRHPSGRARPSPDRSPRSVSNTPKRRVNRPL